MTTIGRKLDTYNLRGCFTGGFDFTPRAIRRPIVDQNDLCLLLPFRSDQGQPCDKRINAVFLVHAGDYN